MKKLLLLLLGSLVTISTYGSDACYAACDKKLLDCLQPNPIALKTVCEQGALFCAGQCKSQ